ncbi:hypothetical protein SVI_0995 [Shewanella violacea DSS12]|uniref:Uncharacterized protein n=1 Tax=Shewanella violacea (strain JCM 10179 / CIP 106290 / LMG 19151 / DSS12) TaxID=637905 RepID=D4ZH17_SHEVD|nr:hypothetical protein SVI_0995 [Shewanella violacea DSS12]
MSQKCLHIRLLQAINTNNAMLLSKPPNTKQAQ